MPSWRHCGSECVKQQFPEAPGVWPGRGRRANSPAPNPDLRIVPLPDPQPQPPTTQRGLATASAEAGVPQGLASLDAVNLQAACRQWVFTLQSARARIGGSCAPPCAPGSGSLSTRLPLRTRNAVEVFLRMFLFRSPGQSRIPSAEFERRCELFRAGHWSGLLRESASAAAVPLGPRRGDFCDAQRARRAADLELFVWENCPLQDTPSPPMQPLADGSSDSVTQHGAPPLTLLCPNLCFGTPPLRPAAAPAGLPLLAQRPPRLGTRAIGRHQRAHPHPA